jgi:serine/threonine-protein kinase
MMKPERWHQIKALLQTVLELDADERSRFLANACAGDQSLQSEVETLIVSYEQAGGFIEEPAFKAMAGSLVDNRTESLTGQTLGRYTIRRHLGAGGMGEVYLADDTCLGRKVALKFLPAFSTSEDEQVRRFQQEARAASALNHPNILTIFEVGQIDSRHFIATEFVEGETLRQHLLKATLPTADLLAVATQVASALTAAHQSGIVHRDIKPENIMLRQDGIVKVLDFGLAKLVEHHGRESVTTAFHTLPGVIMGTPHYMSPEQARGLTVDARTDIWSLGVLLYEMVGGRVPFGGETSSDVIVSILEKEPVPLARLRLDAPEVLQWIISKALRKDLDQRYQTAKEVLADLQGLKHRLELETEVKMWPGASSITGVGRASGLAEPVPNKYEQAMDSIAILPLANTGADPGMEYLSDGITESIINTLSGLSDLKVMAWTTVCRYKGQPVGPSIIGQELGVRTVLTGRVIQVGDRLVVKVELVNTRDGTHLWGEQYNAKPADVFEVEAGISRDISAKLRRRLTPKQKLQLARRHTENVDAYHAYLKGRYYWNKRDTISLEKGVEYFREAIDIDPAYAYAYAGLSDSYTLLVVREARPPAEGFAKAKAAAVRALEIDEAFAQAHSSLGHAMLHNWEWEDAERELKRAIELSPGYASSHHWYSELLTATGRCDESIAELKLAGELDPLSLIISADLGRAFYYARRYDQVMKQEARTLEMDSNFWLSHLNLGRAYLQTGMHAEAIAEFQQAAKYSPGNTEVLAFLAFAFAAAGKTDSALKTLADLSDPLKHSYVPPYHFAVVHAGLGNRELAFEWLERAFASHAVDLFTLKVEPMFDGLRADRRFADLVSRVGLAPTADARERTGARTLLKHPSRKRSSRRAIKSLAILPFGNISGDASMDYLSDGITESIINSLSQLPRLRVVARSTVFRYKAKEVDSREIGQVLDVQAVVTGRVRQVGDSLNIGAELIDVESDSQLWGESYNRRLADIFEVQAEIAREIAETLRLRLSGADKGRLARHHTQKAEAYQLYLKGRYHWNKRTVERLRKGLECFQQALEIDPNYALAYAGLSDCYAFRGDVGLAAVPSKHTFAMAKQAALRALEIDNTLAEAYASLAHVNMHSFDWADAEAAFKSALKFNPNQAPAHQWYAFYLLFNAQPDQAIAEARLALELDPLSVTAHGDLGQMFHYTRQYDQAIDLYQKALELEPNRHRVYLWLGWVFEQQGKYDEAIAAFQKALSEESTEPLASLGCAYALSGRSDAARDILHQLEESSTSRYVSPYQMSVLLHSLGDKRKAFEWLEKGYEQRAEWMIYLSVDPRFEQLHEDSRFTDLTRRIGFRSG